jgi:hypothetical protein
MDDIFQVLNQAINIKYSIKKRSAEEFKYDIDTRIKFIIIYNNF